MITIQASKASILNIQTELDLKVGGIQELSAPAVLTELGNAVFTVGGKSFKKAMDLQAKANKKAFHHIYEWNQTGIPTGRLFLLYKEYSSNGHVVIKPAFRQSKTPVPIDPALLQPGKTGKSVASRHIFRDKASVMEKGKPIVYRTSKPVPMTENGEFRFVAAGTLIRNYYPGGREVKGSFEKFYNYWFNTKIDKIMNASGILENIDLETARVLNKNGAGPVEVRNAIISLLKQYSKNEMVV